MFGGFLGIHFYQINFKVHPQWYCCILCVVMFLSFLVTVHVVLVSFQVFLSCKQPQVIMTLATLTLEITFANFKTVLTRIISIVRVPSLCFYKDTHSNYDDELQWPSLSVKLAVNSDRKDTVHKSWWTFTLPLLAVWGEVHRLSSSPSLKKVKAKHNWAETCKVIPAEKS